MGNSEVFENELRALLNRHSIDALCDLPDFVLAQYLVHALVGLKRVRVHQVTQGQQPVGEVNAALAILGGKVLEIRTGSGIPDPEKHRV